MSSAGRPAFFQRQRQLHPSGGLLCTRFPSPPPDPQPAHAIQPFAVRMELLSASTTAGVGPVAGPRTPAAAFLSLASLTAGLSACRELLPPSLPRSCPCPAPGEHLPDCGCSARTCLNEWLNQPCVHARSLNDREAQPESFPGTFLTAFAREEGSVSGGLSVARRGPQGFRWPRPQHLEGGGAAGPREKLC